MAQLIYQIELHSWNGYLPYISWQLHGVRKLLSSILSKPFLDSVVVYHIVHVTRTVVYFNTYPIHATSIHMMIGLLAHLHPLLAQQQPAISED